MGSLLIQVCEGCAGLFLYPAIQSTGKFPPNVFVFVTVHLHHSVIYVSSINAVHSQNAHWETTRSFLLQGWGDSGIWNPILVLVGMITVFSWSPICSWSAVSQISSYTSNRVRSMRGEVGLWKLFSNICKPYAVSFLLVGMSQVVGAHSTLVVRQGHIM